MSDYPMLISNKLHSFRNFAVQRFNLDCLFSYELLYLSDKIITSGFLSEYE